MLLLPLLLAQSRKYYCNLHQFTFRTVFFCFVKNFTDEVGVDEKPNTGDPPWRLQLES